MGVQQLLQQARAVGMKFDRGDCGCGVVICDGQRLAAGSGAAVEDLRSFFRQSMTYQGGDELRGFVLDDGIAIAECLSLRDVSGFDSAGGGQEAVRGAE